MCALDYAKQTSLPSRLTYGIVTIMWEGQSGYKTSMICHMGYYDLYNNMN